MSIETEELKNFNEADKNRRLCQYEIYEREISKAEEEVNRNYKID